MGLFDWVPDWRVEVGGIPINIAWAILIGFCFLIAAVLIYDNCAIASIPVIGFASQMGIEASGGSC